MGQGPSYWYGQVLLRKWRHLCGPIRAQQERRIRNHLHGKHCAAMLSILTHAWLDMEANTGLYHHVLNT